MANADQLRDFVNHMIRPIRNRLVMSITRAVLESVKDSGKMQLAKVKLFAGETREDIERFQNFGFTSVPQSGAEAVALAMGGNREHLIVVVADDRKVRLKDLLPGESAMYNAAGKKIHLKMDGTEEHLISKLKVQNASHELVALLIELIDDIIASKNITGIGPQPMTPDTIAIFQALKTKFQTFKV